MDHEIILNISWSVGPGKFVWLMTLILRPSLVSAFSCLFFSWPEPLLLLGNGRYSVRPIVAGRF